MSLIMVDYLIEVRFTLYKGCMKKNCLYVCLFVCICVYVYLKNNQSSMKEDIAKNT